MHICILQYVSLRRNMCENSNRANTVRTTNQIKFSRNEMQDSVVHSLEKSFHFLYRTWLSITAFLCVFNYCSFCIRRKSSSRVRQISLEHFLEVSHSDTNSVRNIICRKLVKISVVWLLYNDVVFSTTSAKHSVVTCSS